MILFNKINKLVKAFAAIIKQPSLLNHVLNDNDVRCKEVAEKYPLLRKGLPVVAFNTFLSEKASVVVNPFCFLDGGSLPTDLALLRLLAESIQDCRYFEIGTWRGESVANVAAIAKECHTLCLSDEQMRGIGLPEEYIHAHSVLSKDLVNVTQWHGDSTQFDYADIGNVDLVFIDGNHQYDFVKKDTKAVFEHLVGDNTIVVWHDYALEPETIRWEVLLGILDGIPPQHRERLYHVSNSKCAIFYPKGLTGKQLVANAPVERIFEVTVGVSA